MAIAPKINFRNGRLKAMLVAFAPMPVTDLENDECQSHACQDPDSRRAPGFQKKEKSPNEELEV
jgi:hypothetical protein